MTIRISKYFGINLRRMSGSDEKMYLTGVVWFPRNRKTLGYIYPSCRWF